MKTLKNAMNSSTYYQEPILLVFTGRGLFKILSNLKISDLASKYINMIDIAEAKGKAATKLLKKQIYNYLQKR